MRIYSVTDKEFKEYGRVVEGDFSDLLKALAATLCPEDRTVYVASDPALEAVPSFRVMKESHYGGMPIQIGYCNGHNERLNCLEYHMDSEINLSDGEFILLLGRRQDMVGNTLDTSTVKAFKVPAGVAVEVFATTLHYAPCGVDGNGFRVIVVLPKGTNVASLRSEKEPLLWMTNKWLLAHESSKEASKGAFVGLKGANIEL